MFPTTDKPARNSGSDDASRCSEATLSAGSKPTSSAFAAEPSSGGGFSFGKAKPSSGSVSFGAKPSSRDSVGLGAAKPSGGGGASFAKPSSGGGFSFGKPKPSSGSVSFGAKPSSGVSAGWGAAKPSSGGGLSFAKPSSGGGFSFGKAKPSSGSVSFGAQPSSRDSVGLGAAKPSSGGGLSFTKRSSGGGFSFGKPKPSSGSVSFGAEPSSGVSVGWGAVKPSSGGGLSFGRNELQTDEGVNVSFSFQDCEKRVSPAHSSSFLWGEQGADLLPADGESALRELSKEEFCQTGPYGSLLHLMVARYKPETVEAALDLFPDSALSSVDEHGQTVLHAMAAYGGSLAALERVLQRTGAQILATFSANGSLPLHVSAQKSLGLVPKMLEETPEGDLAHQTAQGANVLHLLAENKASKDQMQACIARLPKECLAQKDACGRTPLHTAVDAGNEAVLLLAAAAPTDVLLMEDDRGLCALEVALLMGRLGSAFSGNDETLLRLVDMHVQKGVMERKKEWKTISPLHAALGRCKEEVLTALLCLPQARGWLQRCDPVTGVLPIHYIVWKSSMFRRLNLVRVLELMTPEDISRPIAGSSTTALHLAVMKSLGDTGLRLLDATATCFDVDAVDTKGRSLLALALTTCDSRNKGCDKLLRRILAMSTSRTPLTVADWQGVGERVEVSLLLAICAHYDRGFFSETAPADWEGGITPLYCACYHLKGANPFEAGDDKEAYKRDLAALLELLPEWFASVRHRGQTPLHVAVKNGNLIAVEQMLDLQIGPTAAMICAEPVDSLEQSMSGTAFEEAIWLGNIGMVRLFLEKVPGIRTVATTRGQTLSEYVDGLYAQDPEAFAEIKAAIAPAIKSAAQ